MAFPRLSLSRRECVVGQLERTSICKHMPTFRYPSAWRTSADTLVLPAPRPTLRVEARLHAQREEHWVVAELVSKGTNVGTADITAAMELLKARSSRRGQRSWTC
jgi:hypothetical protein